MVVSHMGTQHTGKRTNKESNAHGCVHTDQAHVVSEHEHEATSAHAGHAEVPERLSHALLDHRVEEVHSLLRSRVDHLLVAHVRQVGQAADRSSTKTESHRLAGSYPSRRRELSL